MALSVELLRRLDQEEEPLPKRLRLALTVFESNDLPVQRKEELILNWLCEYGQKNRNSEDVWPVLKACFNSSHMKKLSGANIRPPVKSFVSEILCELLKSDRVCKNSKCVILECALCVLEDTNFQLYFKQHLEQFFDYISVILDVVISEENVDFCIRILQTICAFNKQVIQKEVFSVLFIQKALQVTIKILECIPSQRVTDSTTTRVKFEIFKCVQQVLFPKTRFKEISLALLSLFGGKSGYHSATLETLLESLSSAVINNEPDSTVHLFSIVLQAFVSSYKGDTVSVHRMFISMCYLVGFKPEVKLNSAGECKVLLKHKTFKKSFPGCHIQKVLEINETSMKVVRNLLGVLSDASIGLHDDSNEVPFQDWLQALMSTVFSCTSKDSFSVVLLEVMCAFIRLQPLIIEPNIRDILEYVMLAKKQTEEIRVVYVSFFCDVLKMFVKLNRLQKFVAKLLSLGTILNSREVEELPTLPDVLPTQFCIEFQSAVALLPGGQTVELMKTLLFHLNQDCVAVLDKQQGDCHLLLFQIISKFLCHFLRGTRVAEHSVPAHMVLKFSNMMTDLHDLLGKLGQALLHRKHNCPLMLAFLQLCYNWGEMKILLSHYSVKLEHSTDLQLAALQEDISATNLTYLHPYLNSELWNLVAQRIDNFGEADCKELLVKLILQKLRVIILYVDNNKTRQDVISSIARHLLSHIKEAGPLILSGTNAFLVTPFLKPEQLEHLASHIVQEISDKPEGISELMDALQKPGVQENRVLVLAFACAALNKIIRLFCRTKRKHDSPNHLTGCLSLTRKVLTQLEPCHILTCLSNGEPKALTAIVTDMANALNETFKKEEGILVTNGWKPDIAAMQRYLQILNLLPLQHAPGNVKSLVVISVLALAVTLEGSDISRADKQFSTVRSALYRNLLLGLLDSPGPPDLSSYVHMGQLVHWLMSVDLPLSSDLQCLLFQRLFESSLSHSSALHQLQDSMPILQKHSSSQSQDLNALKPAVILLQVLSKCPDQHENSGDHVLCLKYQQRLSRCIIRIMDHLDGAADLPVVLDGYNLVLIRCLKEGDCKLQDKLVPHLGRVVEACLSHVRSKDLPALSPSIKSSLDILATLLQYRAQLKTGLPSDFLPRVWTELMSQDVSACLDTVHNSEHIQLVFEAATEKELYAILQDLKAITVKALQSFKMLVTVYQSVRCNIPKDMNLLSLSVLQQMSLPSNGKIDSEKDAIQSSENPELLKTRFSMWKAVIRSRFSDGKINARKMALEQLCQMLTVFVDQLGMTHVTSAESSMLPILELLLAVASNSLLFVSAEMLDLCFESVIAALAVDTPDILPLCSVSLQLLQTLMKSHEYLVLDCIPSLLQCYQQLATAIASHAHVDLKYSPAQVKAYAVCAHRLERLTNLLKEHKPHFVRVAGYMVADLLQYFETYTLYPEVKIHYSNCIHSLLSICDSHVILFLSRTLTPASQLLLKTFYTTYNKFHRFTGKV